LLDQGRHCSIKMAWQDCTKECKENVGSVLRANNALSYLG
jgi:hypothetical protein